MLLTETAPLPTISPTKGAPPVTPLDRSSKRPRVWFEVLVIVWLCWAYDAIANLAPLRQAAAHAHAASLLRAEQALHIDPEAWLEHWLGHHHWLAVAVSNYYDNAHFVVTLALVGLLWWRFPGQYRPLRTGLVLMNVIGMAVFWLYPTAPPRLLDPARFPDIVANTQAFGSWHKGTLATAANQLAAMPSLHIAWAAWSALALWRVLPRRRWTGAVWAYPAITSVAVMATGNHFLLDVVAGAATFAIAMLVADRWQGWWTTRLAERALATGSEPATTAAGEPGTRVAADK
jgi:PAP2 superfamily